MQCIFKVQSNFISFLKSKIQISFIMEDKKIFWGSSNDKGVRGISHIQKIYDKSTSERKKCRVWKKSLVKYACFCVGNETLHFWGE